MRGPETEAAPLETADDTMIATLFTAFIVPLEHAKQNRSSCTS